MHQTTASYITIKQIYKVILAYQAHTWMELVLETIKICHAIITNMVINQLTAQSQNYLNAGILYNQEVFVLK